MGRPKTIAILRETALSHGEKAIARLVKYAEQDDKDDPRMAAVIERACEALLDRIGLTPAKPQEVPADEKPLPERPMTPQDIRDALRGVN